MLKKQDNGRTSEFKITFFFTLFHFTGTRFQIGNFPHHHSSDFHHSNGSKLLCF